MSTQSGYETEIKLALADETGIETRLAEAGFTVSVPREFESNTIYDTVDRKLLAAGSLLRLRQTGSNVLITWKGPVTAGPHKSRPEIETTAGSLEALAGIVRELGFQPTFRYEKYRTEFVSSQDPTCGVITFDETPIGHFLELEGPADWIDSSARRLGFSERDYVLSSYAKLYL